MNVGWRDRGGRGCGLGGVMRGLAVWCLMFDVLVPGFWCLASGLVSGVRCEMSDV